MRTRRFGGQAMLLTLGATLFALRAGAQTPTEPPMPDAVSGEASPSDKPPEPPPEPPPAVPVGAAAGAAAGETAAPAPAPAAAPAEQPAPAKPGEYSRRGLYFSFGVGTSIVSYQLDQRNGDSLVYAGPVTNLAPATLLKIGYGIGDQTAVHLTNRIAWLAHADPAATDFHERIWTMSAITGLGVTHFLDREQRTWYLGGDVGVSQWLAFQDFSRDLRDVGFGACLELGVQFFKGLSFEHSVCYATVTSYRRGVDAGAEIDAEIGSPLSASFTLNYLK